MQSRLENYDFRVTPPGQERAKYYSLIGIFWLRTGNDRLDVLPLGGVDVKFRCVLRRRTGLDPLDDNGRAVLARATSGRHVHRGARQLDGQFSRRNRFSKHEGEFCFIFLAFLKLNYAGLGISAVHFQIYSRFRFFSFAVTVDASSRVFNDTELIFLLHNALLPKG